MAFAERIVREGLMDGGAAAQRLREYSWPSKIMCAGARVSLERLPDGGLTAYSEDVPGFLLSNSDPLAVIRGIEPAILGILGPEGVPPPKLPPLRIVEREETRETRLLWLISYQDEIAAVHRRIVKNLQEGKLKRAKLNQRMARNIYHKIHWLMFQVELMSLGGDYYRWVDD